MSWPRATDDGLSIAKVAELTRVDASTLRIWELRFGWPRPRRLSNGYRSYPASIVPQIIRLAKLKAAGHKLKNIIVDGFPRWPENEPAFVPPSWSCVRQLQPCRTVAASTFKARLIGDDRAEDVDDRIGLVQRRDAAAIICALHEAVITLRPGDRLPGAWLPAYFGAREWERCGRPLAKDVGKTIARVAGPVVLADVAARWDTAEAIG